MTGPAERDRAYREAVRVAEEALFNAQGYDPVAMAAHVRGKTRSDNLRSPFDDGRFHPLRPGPVVIEGEFKVVSDGR